MGVPDVLLTHFEEQIKSVRSKLAADPLLSNELDPDSENRDRAEELLDAFLDDERAEAERKRNENRQSLWLSYEPRAVDENPAGKTILKADRRVQVAIVRAWFGRTLRTTLRMDNPSAPGDTWRADELVNRLFRRILPYTDLDMQWILRCLLYRFEVSGLIVVDRMNISGLFRSFARSVESDELSGEMREMLREIQNFISDNATYAAERKIVDLIDGMLGADRGAPLIEPADDWGHYANDALALLTGNLAGIWSSLIELAATMAGTRPSQKWLLEASEYVRQLGEYEFSRLTIEWFGLLDRPSRDVLYKRADGFDYPSAVIADRNAEIIKGLAWACTSVESDALAAALGDAALACYKKIPNNGARSTKAGNACVHALGTVASLTAIAQLQRVLQRVKLPSQRKQVEEALSTAAQARGLSSDDLDELVVPSFGLVDGVVRRTFGEFTAELFVRDSSNVDMRWLKPDGKRQKAVPAPVKREYAVEVKELKRTQKEIRETLTAQRSRIERLMIGGREWSYSQWRERYFDHPLVSTPARRLIWSFEREDRTAIGIWLDGGLVDANGELLDWLDDRTMVRLWHPIKADASTVLDWREWLERHEVTQPFKQAHREIYILTDAERETEMYSNRFAAHIIRQHQFAALCQERGWRYRLQGAWDGFNVPVLELPHYGIGAEFWVEGIEQGDGEGLSHAFVYLYATTNQVRFIDLASGESIPLTEIPPRVFSEVMRDADLFVGVASIGADPHWLDGGESRLAGHQDYWWNYSFGDLTARAEVRREALARLLLRMAKLDGRWELDGRFLRIQGDLRGYKIHLGSGNILMEPNDQYLCIAPGRGAGGSRRGDGLFLPFEGDQTLAVIISKALMLADDTGISDPTIMRQISK